MTRTYHKDNWFRNEKKNRLTISFRSLWLSFVLRYWANSFYSHKINRKKYNLWRGPTNIFYFFMVKIASMDFIIFLYQKVSILMKNGYAQFTQKISYFIIRWNIFLNKKIFQKIQLLAISNFVAGISFLVLNLCKSKLFDS